MKDMLHLLYIIVKKILHNHLSKTIKYFWKNLNIKCTINTSHCISIFKIPILRYILTLKRLKRFHIEAIIFACTYDLFSNSQSTV